MHFFVTNQNYDRLSDHHNTKEEATQYAVEQILNREIDDALVVGMECEEFSTKTPLYVLLRVKSYIDLDHPKVP